jgi:NAD(P)-dependent dehydrogenase (short-subunit alcohol dehydrogenase family)
LILPQRVIVTAGAAGIGQAIARAFLADGAEVAICDVDAAALAAMKHQHDQLRIFEADVSDAHSVGRFCCTAVTAMGGVDVLVNNAGIGGPRAPIEETDEADWRRCIDVNLTGAFLMMKAVLPIMKQVRSGVIINISTSSAKTGLPNRGAYVASKAGLIALSHNTAREVGTFNIRCNAVLPGVIDNPRGRMLLEAYGAERGLSKEEAEAAFLSFVSMRTMIAPEEVAAICVFLASDAARHITGQAIGVDGNMEWES